MNDFGSRLKDLREEKKLPAKSVVEKLAMQGYEISAKTLYGYEKGIRMPNADIFIELCKIYGCKNILKVFGNIDIDYSIPSDFDWKIIEKYHDLDAHGKDMVNLVLDKESDRCENEYIELVARGGKYKVKKADVIEWAKQLDSKDCEEDRDLF